jgi:hypothetical protein
MGSRGRKSRVGTLFVPTVRRIKLALEFAKNGGHKKRAHPTKILAAIEVHG